MSTIGERLKMARGMVGISQTELSRRSGVIQQTISKLENGEVHKTTGIVALARVLGVNPNWLSDEVGGMLDNPTSSIPNGASVASWINLDDLPDKDAYVVIPHFDVSLSAGNGDSASWVEHTNNDPILFRKRFFRARGLQEQSCKAVYVRGNSMAPTLESGDTVLIDTNMVNIVDGDVYAILYYDDLYIKRLYRIPGGGIEARSDNQEHKSFEIKDKDLPRLKILGRQVWRGG